MLAVPQKFLLLKTTMKTDEELRLEVEEALRWTPDIEVGTTSVTVLGGVVTLHGAVQRYATLFAAERVARRIAGVADLINAIEVHVPAAVQRSDAEIADQIRHLLAAQRPLADLGIAVLVRGGWTTLEGEVDWFYQKEFAEAAIRSVESLRGISNAIQVRPKLDSEEIKHQIADAFRRDAHADATHIQVHTEDGSVILTGTVRSWHERDRAERAAWAAPGVHRVEDRIVVRP